MIKRLFSWGYLLVIVFVAFTTCLKYLAQSAVVPTQGPFIYLFAVVPAAIFFGFRSAILACILSILAFDYFFIPPVHMFKLLNIHYLPVIAIFLLVGTSLSYFASRLRLKTQEAIQEAKILKQNEVELTNYRANLEELIKQRTLELEKANTELKSEVAERKKAEEIRSRYERLATIGELSAGISHELKNPLAVIDSSVFVLEQRMGSDKSMEKYLKRIRASIWSCINTIDALLSITRPENICLNRVEIKSLISGFILKNDVPPGVNVVQDFPQEDIYIEVDERQLSIAFYNIVRNAVQTMENMGTLTIHVGVNNGMIEVSFSDTGPGIATENLGRIFEPLFTTKAKGIGMGLVITKMIVEKHGGTIAVYSKPGNGATFTLSLPRCNNGET